ncbi:MAG TPA: hypothetical protein VF730_01610 [Terracidiphilus sp.]
MACRPILNHVPAIALKHTLIAAASLVFGVFGGVIGAIATWPFWDWFEAKTGIESMGHSGPADWVFYFMAGLAAVIAFAALEFVFRKKHSPEDRSIAV